MLKNKISAGSILLSALSLISLGILLIIFNSTIIDWLYLLLGLFFIGYSILELIILIIRNMSKPKNKRLNLMKLLVIFIIGILILIFPNLFIALYPLSFALYSLLNGVVEMISYIQLKMSNSPYRLHLLISSILSFIFFIFVLFRPLYYVEILTILTGVYLICYGLFELGDAFHEFSPTFFKKPFFNFKIALPPFLSTFIPHRVLIFINKSIASGKESDIDFSVKKVESKPDLEIFIYVGEKGVHAFGHIDFCFENYIYSYGAYDESTSKLFGSLGDGCYYKTKFRNRYLKFCVEIDNKTVFAFGITLTDNQKKLIRDEIKSIEKDVYPWKPPYERDIDENGISKEKYIDFASNLSKYTDAKFFKFSRSSFKYYFVMYTNCVKLPERILQKSGARVLAYSGIISPGTFYDYLNYEFMKPNSNVISRTIYHKENLGELNDNDIDR